MWCVQFSYFFIQTLICLCVISTLIRSSVWLIWNIIVLWRFDAIKRIKQKIRNVSHIIIPIYVVSAWTINTNHCIIWFLIYNAYMNICSEITTITAIVVQEKASTSLLISTCLDAYCSHRDSCMPFLWLNEQIKNAFLNWFHEFFHK